MKETASGLGAPVAQNERSFAVIGDVQGDLQALNTVLEEIDRRGAQHIIAAGNLLLGGHDAAEVWRVLQQRKVYCLRGIGDVALASVPEQRVRNEVERGRLGEPTELESRADAFFKAREQLGEVVLHALTKLPPRLRMPMPDGNELLILNGTPFDPGEAFTPDLTDDELHTLLADDPADILISCGGHIAFSRDLDATRIHAMGSVSTLEALPSGEDAMVPPEHTRVAHFTWVTPRYTETTLEHAWVTF